MAINPFKSAKKKMHLKMSSAEVVCCKESPNIADELGIEANSVNPEQTFVKSSITGPDVIKKIHTQLN